MATHIDVLTVRRRLGRDDWLPPQEFGPDGWTMSRRDRSAAVIITCAEHDGAEWIHASIAGHGRLPSYEEMCELHRAIWGDTGYAYQVHVPREYHVNIHEHALHLWGRLDGAPVLPEFGMAGSI